MHNTPGLLHTLPEIPCRIEGAGYYETGQGTRFPLHQHHVWELVYYASGQSHCTIADKVYEGFPGVVLLTPPETAHTDYAHTAFGCFFVVIAAPEQHPWPRLCFDDADQTLGRLCRTIVREWNLQVPGREMMLAALTAQLNIVLCRANEYQSLSAAERMVLQAEGLLEERFASRLTIKELAQEMHISPSTLYTHFAQVGHPSPLAYLQGVRFRHALSYLRTSSFTLEVIAQLCGYDSASHLSRQIKRVTGKSPGAFRARDAASPRHSIDERAPGRPKEVSE